jgi:hypothetical protein
MSCRWLATATGPVAVVGPAAPADLRAEMSTVLAEIATKTATTDDRMTDGFARCAIVDLLLRSAMSRR